MAVLSDRVDRFICTRRLIKRVKPGKEVAFNSVKAIPDEVGQA